MATVTDKPQRTIRIKWVRSGIGFSYRQKEMIRSLGLRRLHQIVERPDTPQIRGLVARIPHLVEMVEGTRESVALPVPEYTLLPPEPIPAKAAPAPVEVESAEAVGVATFAVAPSEPSRPAVAEKAPAEKTAAVSAKRRVKKAAKPAAAAKKKPAKAEEAKKAKAGAGKSRKPKKTSKK